MTNQDQVLNISIEICRKNRCSAVTARDVYLAGDHYLSYSQVKNAMSNLVAKGSYFNFLPAVTHRKGDKSAVRELQDRHWRITPNKPKPVVSDCMDCELKDIQIEKLESVLKSIKYHWQGLNNAIRDIG